MIVLTVGLFTTHWCSLAIQLKDLHMALKEQEQQIIRDPDATDLIPQLARVIIDGSREFYGTTICTQEDDIDPLLPIADMICHQQSLPVHRKLECPHGNVQGRVQTQPSKCTQPMETKESTPQVTPKQPKDHMMGGKNGGNDKRYGRAPNPPPSERTSQWEKSNHPRGLYQFRTSSATYDKV
jgi:hypothetical protein